MNIYYLVYNGSQWPNLRQLGDVTRCECEHIVTMRNEIVGHWRV